MPYALLTFTDQANRLLAGLRGGMLLVTDDRGESWSELPVRLPGIIELATVPADRFLRLGRGSPQA
jgi:hypothetical protein